MKSETDDAAASFDRKAFGPRTAFAAAVLILGVAVTFWPTVVSIEAIWRRSSTFAHGYVVIPIVLWLIWRQRELLARATAEPFWPGLIVVAAAGIGWMLGDLAGVLSLQQFALYVMLVGSLVAVLGLRVCRVIAFPLAFLVFAVPFGEFLVPVLIDRTADVTVAALRLSGVPVFREGNHFTIPSGRWSVVEACSGVRYLIASVMVGTLYAYLAYRSARKRLLFVLVSILVPIVANWLRAYMIVMLGHLTNNRLAAGVDHVIYGWIFFGMVMIAMFWVGSFWRDDQVAATTPTPAKTATVRSAAPVTLAVVLTLALGIVWRPMTAIVDANTWGVSRGLAAIPAEAGWQPAAEFSPVWSPHYLGARSQRHQWFAKDGRVIGVYLALFSQQTQGRELIVSQNQLVKPDDPLWRQLDESRAQIRWGSHDITVQTAEIDGQDAQLSARAWYWINGRYTASDALAKAWLAFGKLAMRPDYSAVIVIYTPRTGNPTSDVAALEAFASEMEPAVMRTLHQATVAEAASAQTT